MSDPKSTSADRTALRQQVMESESALYRAQIAGSVDQIEPFLSADLVYVHSTGVAESKEEDLAGVADVQKITASQRGSSRAMVSAPPRDRKSVV